MLSGDLPLAVDVTCDMLTASLLRERDVESEREVVLEEIAMRDDDPGDVVHELFAEALYGTHPLGRPIIGSVDSVEGLTRDGIHGFWRRSYTAPSMVVSAAGGLDHDLLVRQVHAAFGALDPSATPRPRRPADQGPPGLAQVVAQPRRTEQAHVVLGTTGLARDDERRWALAVLNNGLGGGMSSRLFQSIREERGLAYSVFSYASSGADTGQLGVYAGCAPKKLGQVLDLVTGRAGPGRREGTDRRRGRPGKGAAAWRDRPGSGGHRVAG